MFLYKRPQMKNRKRIGWIWWVGWYEKKKDSHTKKRKRQSESLQSFFNLPLPVTDRQDAKSLLVELQRKEIDKRLGIEQPDSIPVDGFYLEYCRFCDKNKNRSTVSSDNYRLKRWLNFLSSQKIESMSGITKTLLNQFIAELKGKSNATINRHISLIRASLRWGVRQGYLKENSLKDFSRLTEIHLPKTAEITTEDLDKLLSIKDEKFKLFLQIVYYTLARKREVLQLTWEDIDLKRRVVTYRHTKTKIPRVIPMCDKLVRVVTTFKDSPGKKKIFNWETEYVSRKFQRLRKRLDLKIEGIHRFRHARASELLRKGANIRDIQTMLGHKTPQTTLKIYAQSYLGGLRETVEL